MLGETHTEPTREVLDAVGELTNMISGVARTHMERNGLSVYAAIPSVVVGEGHTISHILKAPSIVIPFSTPQGDFFVDVCIKATQTHMKHQVTYDVVNKPTLPQGKIIEAEPGQKSESSSRPAPPPVESHQAPEPPVKDDSPAGRIDRLKHALLKITRARDDIQRNLEANPFMQIAKRKEQKKLIDVYDDKIRKLKLDLSTAKMLAKMADDNGDLTIKRHFQDYQRKDDK
jgi:hypothetical protein